MHEVVTLQFGQQANYIGTHYWNTQEAYFTYSGQDESPVNHDISFRPGIGADGAETYTPRTVIYDLKGAFGTLRRENALYELQTQENPAQSSPWSGHTVPLQLPPIAPSAYQQALDQGTEPPRLSTDTVRFWSDYNHIFYHPRSIVQINNYELNSSLMPFERWSSGEELFANLDREHDLLDRDLRPFLEECDQVQGLQIFTNTDDAWGGFASKYLERIDDDLGKGCRWVFGVQDTGRTSRERRALQLANVAQSFFGLFPPATMHIPLSTSPVSLPHYASMNISSPWHTAALQSAAIESLTLPTRLRSTENGRTTFDNLESSLNISRMRRMATLSMSVSEQSALEESHQPNGHSDARMTNGYTQEDEEADLRKPLDINFLPDLTYSVPSARNRRAHIFSKFESLRGPWRTDVELQTSQERLHNRSHADEPPVSTHQSRLLFPILPSFPSVFRFPTRPQKLAMETSLCTSTTIADTIRNLVSVTRRLGNVEDRDALCESLAAVADEYEDGFMSDDDDGDDD